MTHMTSTPRAYDTTPLPTVGSTACPADEPWEPWVPLRTGRRQPTDQDGSHNTTAVPPLLLLDVETEAAGEGRDRATTGAQRGAGMLVLNRTAMDQTCWLLVLGVAELLDTCQQPGAAAAHRHGGRATVMTTTLRPASVELRRRNRCWLCAAQRVHAGAGRIRTTPVLVGTVTGCALVLSFRSISRSRMIRLTATIGPSNGGVRHVINIVDVAAADGTGDDGDTRGTAHVSMVHLPRMTVMQQTRMTGARGDIRSSRVPLMARARSRRSGLTSRIAPRTTVGPRLTSLLT